MVGGLTVILVALALPARPPAAMPRDGSSRGDRLAGHVLVYKDIRYKVGPDGPLALDIYAPEFGGPFPVVLAAAGGGWDSDDKDLWYLVGIYLAESGFVGVIADHSLAPPGGTQHANQPAYDLLDAMTWVRAHVGAYNGIPDKIGALGGSSGGELVTMIGAIGGSGTTRPDAVVNWSGLTDLTTDPTDFRPINYVGCEYADCPDLWVAASATSYVTSSAAPTWRGNSTDEDVPLIDAYELDDVLENAGVPHALHILVGTLHGRAYDLRVWDENMAFLRTYIDQSQGPTATFTSGPLRPSWPSRSATFTWTSSDPGATFTCSLDAASPVACSSGLTYENTAVGQHILTVWAADQQGVKGPGATWRWDYDTSGAQQEVGGPGFSPRTISVGMGDNLVWTFSGPGSHSATDDTGMGMYDSGPQPPGASFIYTFTNAGTYRVKDTFTDMTGRIQIPTVAGPLQGSVSDSYLVQWASWTPPPGYVIDVQVLRPDAPGWRIWLRDQVAIEAWFSPDSGPGTYAFRARIRQSASGRSSGYSPAASIKAT